MHSVKILHCADLHLGAEEGRLGAAAARRSAEVLMTFERILRTARTYCVDVLLIAGDLFDRAQPDPGLVKQVFDRLAELENLPVFIAAGNHDYLWSGSPYLSKDLPKNVRVFPTETVCYSLENLGLRVWGRSFGEVYADDGDKLNLTPPTDDFVDICVLHGDTSGADSPYNGLTAERIAATGVDYLALGHLHTYSGICRSGAVFYAYPGCPEGQGFDETGEKGVLVGTVEKGRVDLQFTPCAKRMHLCVPFCVDETASATQSADAVLKHLKTQFGDGFADHLYRIILTGCLPADFCFPADALTARLAEQLYYVQVKDETTVGVDLAALQAEPTLQGVFARRMTEAIAAAADTAERERLQKALELGLKAFYGEVSYREN